MSSTHLKSNKNNKSARQPIARSAQDMHAPRVTKGEDAPLRRKLGSDILAVVDAMEPIAAYSSRSIAELVLSAAISEILIEIVDAPNAEAASAKLEHWLAVIPSRGRGKLRIEARVYDHCARVIANVPTNAAIRRRLWATVSRVRRIFALIARSRKSSTTRSRYAKMIVVSYFWARDYWCGMTIQDVASTLGVSRQALGSSRLVLNAHLPERMRFPEFAQTR